MRTRLVERAGDESSRPVAPCKERVAAMWPIVLFSFAHIENSSAHSEPYGARAVGVVARQLAMRHQPSGGSVVERIAANESAREHCCSSNGRTLASMPEHEPQYKHANSNWAHTTNAGVSLQEAQTAASVAALLLRQSLS